jgi:hypothetical protein
MCFTSVWLSVPPAVVDAIAPEGTLSVVIVPPAPEVPLRSV